MWATTVVPFTESRQSEVGCGGKATGPDSSYVLLPVRSLQGICGKATSIPTSRNTSTLPPTHPPTHPHPHTHLYGAYGQLHEVDLRRLGQHGGAVGSGFVEVRLNRRPVVGDGAVHGAAVVEDEVAVHLRAVQVLQAVGWRLAGWLGGESGLAGHESPVSHVALLRRRACPCLPPSRPPDHLPRLTAPLMLPHTLPQTTTSGA